MTRDEIISMAREAGIGLRPLDDDYCDQIGLERGTICRVSDIGVVELERFAALVAAAEREACAKECERLAEEFAELAQTADVDEAGRHGYSHAESAAVGCAAALRARGQA